MHIDERITKLAENILKNSVQLKKGEKSTFAFCSWKIFYYLRGFMSIYFKKHWKNNL